MKKTAFVALGAILFCGVALAAIPLAPTIVETPPAITVAKSPIIGYAVQWEGSIFVDHGGGNPGAHVELECKPSGGQWVQVQYHTIGCGSYVNHLVSGPYYSTNNLNWYRVTVTNMSGAPSLKSSVSGTFTLP